MNPQPPGEAVARIAVLFGFVALFNAFSRGEAGAWAKAKFLNADAPSSGRDTFGNVHAFAGIGDAASGALDDLGTTAEGTATAVDLVAVGSTKMSSRFASRWRPLVAAAAAQGITLTGDAYRSSAQQKQLRIAHCKDWRNTPASACHPPTAKVGTSRHETGDAIDVHLSGSGDRRSPEYVWLARNASRFGVHNLPSEPWHWSIDGR